MKKSKLIWILLTIPLFIEAGAYPGDDIERTHKLLSPRKQKRLFVIDDNDNLYHLAANDINPEPRLNGKGLDGDKVIELVNLAENITSDNNASLSSVVSNDDYPVHRGDVDVSDDYKDITNESSGLMHTSKGVNRTEVTAAEASAISATTISWLESFMFLYRNWQWILFNTLFMLTWIFFAIFAIYRLIGLYWCSLIFSRSLYLVLHLLIFTAATFSIVQLLHLSYGNYQGLPLFLTLLLTHTPSPCLALACCIVIRSILAAANVAMCGRYIASLVHVAIFATVVLLLSFIGDVVVGVSHSSVVLAVVRFSVTALCALPLILFIYKYVQIRGIHKSLQREFVRELKSLVPNRRNDLREDGVDIRGVLRSILNPWAQLTVFSAGCGIFMLLCNFSLSLFFTISDVSLALFWVLHSVLFLSQVGLVLSLTVGVALTLTNVTTRNVLRRYFAIPLPVNDPSGGAFLQHGNFIYQRVAVNNVCNGTQPPNNLTTERLESERNNIAVEAVVERPRVNVRRSATFNCPPRPYCSHSPQPYTNPYPILSDHLLTTYPLDERGEPRMGATPYRNVNYCRKNNIQVHCKPIGEAEEHSFSPGKFPIMGCNGRSRYGSLHSLPNISPRIRSHPASQQYYGVGEGEPFISIPEHSPNVDTSPVVDNGHETGDDKTGHCVKEIIMENQNLFRSHSLRQNSMRRKIRNRERLSIRTVPPQVHNGSPLLVENGKVEVSEKIDSEEFGAEKIPSTEHPPTEFFPSSGGSPGYDKNFVDSPSPHYLGVENGNFYSESNPSRRSDIYTYQLRDPSAEFEMRNGKSPFVPAFGNNTDSERSAMSEVSSLRSEFSTCTQGDKCKDRFTENSPGINHSADNSFSTTNPEVNDIITPYEATNGDFSAFTLPVKKRASLKRNHSSASFETQDLPNVTPPTNDCPPGIKNGHGTNWYGTWAGRKSKRRNLSSNDGSNNLRKLSASKSSLSNLYEKIKTRRHKSSMTSIDTLDVDEEVVRNGEALRNELVIVETKDESEDEMLPKISEDIDLAAEILKSSTMLADFLVSKDSDLIADEAAINPMEERSLQTSPLEVST